MNPKLSIAANLLPDLSQLFAQAADVLAGLLRGCCQVLLQVLQLPRQGLLLQLGRFDLLDQQVVDAAAVALLAAACTIPWQDLLWLLWG